MAKIKEDISANNELTQKTNSQINFLKSVQEEYETLSEKAGRYGENLDKMTETEQSRYLELTDTFASYNDSIIRGYDAQGRAIIDNQTALQETIDMLREEAELTAQKNLGNVNEKNKVYNKDIVEKQEAQKQAQSDFDNGEFYFLKNKVKYDEDNNLIDDFTDADFLGSIQAYNQYVVNLKEEVRTSIIETKNGQQTVEELAMEAMMLTNAAATAEGLTLEQFNQLKEYDALLEDFFVQENFNKEKNFEKFERAHSPILALAEAYQNDAETAETLQTNLDAANKALLDAQSLDSNYLLSVIQYSNDHNSQWKMLSEGAQNISSRFITDYIGSLNFDDLAAEAAQNGEEGKIYELAIEKTQQYVEDFGKAFDLVNTSLETAIEDADLKSFEGTSKEYKEKIIGILQEVINGIEDEELQDQGVQQALERYFKKVLGLDTLNIDFDTGKINEIITGAENTYKNAAETLQQKMLALDLYPSKGGLVTQWVESILTEDEAANINDILSNFDFDGFSQEDLQDIQTFGKYLREATDRAQEAESSTQKYNQAIENNESILKKFENKESLTEAEKEYLAALEQEYPLLKANQRGTQDYANTMAAIQKNQKEKYKNDLKEEKALLQNNLDEKKALLKTYEEGTPDYQEQLEKIEADEGRIQDIDYELNVVLVADPSIKDQLKNLYDEKDTLLSIRATVEADEALSEDQSKALADFFTSEEGQAYGQEYLNNGGRITDAMLNALDDFILAKQEVLESTKDSLEEETQAYLDAEAKFREQADIYKQRAEEQRLKGNEKLASYYDGQAEVQTQNADANQTLAASNMESLISTNSQEIENIATSIDSINE